MKYSILLALFAIVGTVAVVGFASPQKNIPNNSYQFACTAMVGELALRDSGILTAEQKEANSRRIKYLLALIEEFKP